MNTAELKIHLHQLIVETNDNSVLLSVKDCFKSTTKGNETKDWWITLPSGEKKPIRTGFNNLKQGSECIAHRDVRKKIDLLLSKN